MKGIGKKLIGDAEHFTFEQRVFNFALLLGICMTVFGTIMDMFYGGDLLISLAFFGCWILTYYLSIRVKRYFNLVSVALFGVLVFAFVPYNWILSRGINGVIPYYVIVIIAIISIVLSGYFRIVMVLSMLAVELLLICRDAFAAGSFEALIASNMTIFEYTIHIIVIMATMIALVIGYSNTYMKEKSRREAYARTIEEQFHQQRYYMENLEELTYKLKSERHDFNNHLGVIYGLLESKETQEARRYTTQLVKTAEEYQSIVNIPYSMIRAMLNYKLSVARESKIELRLNVEIPVELKLNEFDLTVILGNLLDNAMEACVEVDDNSRYIDLDIHYKPDYLIIQMENPMNRELVFWDGRTRTSKPDFENHGIGLCNIEYLVNKHNGLLKIELENGAFKVNIALLVNK